MSKKDLIVKKLYEYRSNNSGGFWWLKDENWLALEEAGWEVIWGGSLYFCGQSWDRPEVVPDPYCEDCQGHKRFSSFESLNKSPKNRYLGRAAATSARKEFYSKGEAIAEFERVADQNYYSRGCPCCGSPHDIYEVKD